MMKSNGIESVKNLEFKIWKINGKIHINGGVEQIVTPLAGDFLKRLGILNIEF